MLSFPKEKDVGQIFVRGKFVWGFLFSGEGGGLRRSQIIKKKDFHLGEGAFRPAGCGIA